MDTSIEPIPLTRLMLMFIPVLVVILIQVKWAMPTKPTLYGMGRMVLQLLLIGYILLFIFETEHGIVVLLVLVTMIAVSSWIALRPIASQRSHLYLVTLASISIAGLPILFLGTKWVLEITPWYAPRYVIPLAGMIFANSMNSISIAAERLTAELDGGSNPNDARRKAFAASLIPLVNSLMAVGLVTIPGIMTGQVLAGISPLIAARYQIMMMCMLFGSSGIATACFLYWSRTPKFPKESKI
ncbi:MAG: ABC transporter permease [Gammaproteobacteria bacterium]|nr:ABC transporter permease [Gammaproteobacteria bacterium]